MSYPDDMARLARAVAALTAAGPAAARTLQGQQRQAVLVARNTLAAELRDLTGAVLGHPARPEAVRSDLKLITASPAHALYAALSSVPVLAEPGLSLTDALTVAADPYTAAWQATARAAIALQPYHRLLVESGSGDDAWMVARDVADLAAALPVLDADLAAALPADDQHISGPLLDPAAHSLVRLAAAELTAQTADLAAGSAGLEITPPTSQRVPLVGTVAALPDATRHLTALLAGRGAELTALEARAVARALADGAELTARVLTGTGLGPAASDAAGLLTAALPHLQRVFEARVATLTTPAAQVVVLTQQIRERINALAGLVDRLNDTASSTELARIALPLARWAGEAAATARQLADNLQTAETTGRLLAPRLDTARGRTQRYLWLPTSQGLTGPHPAMTAAATAAADLTAAEQPLATLAGIPTAAERARAATLRAVAAAGTGFTDLQTALATRPPQPPVRRPHPALAPPRHGAQSRHP